MSDHIKAGDMVVVVRPRACCGATDALGMVFKVKEVRYQTTAGCPFCRVAATGFLAIRPDGRGGLISRVKKIEPLPDEDEIDTSAPIKTPAPATV